jgi:Ca-activated chloride channel family protein
MHIGSPAWIHALWLVPLTGLLVVFAYEARRRLLRRFADSSLLPALTPRVRPAVSVVRGVLLVAAVGGLVFALMRPQWNEREYPVTRRGREIVFVVDVSRSMLARDLAPNRLERAKLWMRDLVGSLEGDSVGLVAFAGVPVIKCPLTRDVGFFEMAVEQLSPESAPRGGTMIGDAIRKAVGQVFERTPDDEPDRGRFRDIILITDGEDQGSLPIEAAKAAADAGIRIIALGIGSETQGAPVPQAADEQDFIRYQGQTVRSKLDAGALADIAGATPGGVFLNVGTGDLNLEDIYRDLIASAPSAELETLPIVQYDEMFWVFLAGSVACLFAEGLLEDRGRIRA